MTDPSTRFVTAELSPRLQRLRGSLSSGLAGLLDDLLGRHGWTDNWERLLNPLGQPVVQLPYWCSEIVAGGETGGLTAAMLDNLAEATVVGYLHVRVEDDLIDESGWSVEAALLLAEALLIRHVSLLGRIGISGRFWDYFERKGWDYCDAMLLERRLLNPSSSYGEAEFDSVLRRSAALVIPSAVVLDVADRWDLLGDVETLVWHAVRSGQLVDDLIDAADDLERGNLTWVVRRLGGGEGRRRLLERLGLGGGLDEIIGDVHRDLDRAAEVASRLAAHAAGSWLVARRTAVVDLQERFFAQLLGAVAEAPVDVEQ